jgi:hypothetical protein
MPVQPRPASAAIMSHSTATLWELTTSTVHWFPQQEGDHLMDENNYLPWSILMLSSFNSCDLKGIITGIETEAAATDKVLWKKMDRDALNVLMGCIMSNLVIKVSSAKLSNKAWDTLTTEFGQSGVGSVMLWFYQLVKPYTLDDSLPKHIKEFQGAVKQLQITSFEISDHITAAIFLCTLPSDPHDPESWYQHI